MCVCPPAVVFLVRFISNLVGNFRSIISWTSECVEKKQSENSNPFVGMLSFQIFEFLDPKSIKNAPDIEIMHLKRFRLIRLALMISAQYILSH